MSLGVLTQLPTKTTNYFQTEKLLTGTWPWSERFHDHNLAGHPCLPSAPAFFYFNIPWYVYFHGYKGTRKFAMLFATWLQSILTDVSSNQFWRNFPVKGIASWLVDIGGQILQGMGLKSLNSSQQIRNRTPAGAREWDRLAVEGQAAAWIWSLYIPKIKNRRHFPPLSLLILSK